MIFAFNKVSPGLVTWCDWCVPPDLFLFLLEGVSNELEDLRWEQVDATTDGCTHKCLWFLHIMCHLQQHL